MSWVGDNSEIYKKFEDDPEFWMLKYNKGMDEFLQKEFDIHKYRPVCGSYLYTGFIDWPITLFNQAHNIMREEGPWQKYTLSV